MAGRDSHQGNSCPRRIVMPLLSAQEQRGLGEGWAVLNTRGLSHSHTSLALSGSGEGVGTRTPHEGLYSPAYQPPTIAWCVTSRRCCIRCPVLTNCECKQSHTQCLHTHTHTHTLRPLQRSISKRGSGLRSLRRTLLAAPRSSSQLLAAPRSCPVSRCI